MATCTLSLGTLPSTAVVAKLQERIGVTCDWKRILLPSERYEMNSAYDLECSELRISFRNYHLRFISFEVTVCLSSVKWTFSRTFPFRSSICIPCFPHSSIHIHTYVQRKGADKSLARATSRCRMTESIVSLERGVCSCAELQVYSCYRGWNEACQATRAISTTWRRELLSSFFPPARQGAEGNSRHSDRNIRGKCTIVCHRQKLCSPV